MPTGTSATAPQITRKIVDILTGDPAASREQILSGILGPAKFDESDRRLGIGVVGSPFKGEQRPARRWHR